MQSNSGLILGCSHDNLIDLVRTPRLLKRANNQPARKRCYRTYDSNEHLGVAFDLKGTRPRCGN